MSMLLFFYSLRFCFVFFFFFVLFFFFFFFQAEDGIRDDLVTGVQTCALPILVGGVVAIDTAHRGVGERGAPDPVGDIRGLVAQRRAAQGQIPADVIGHRVLVPQRIGDCLEEAAWGRDRVPGWVVAEVHAAGDPSSVLLPEAVAVRGVVTELGDLPGWQGDLGHAIPRVVTLIVRRGGLP